MNYENSINGLIKQLKGISNGLMEDEFPKCANVVKKAATAISTLQAENKRLKSLLGESGQDLWSKENQRADRLEAENKKLRAELEQVKRERDEAVHDRMMMEQSVGELSARAESAEADNKKLCAAMMQLKRTDRPNRMSVIYELEYDSSMSHKTMEEVAFIVFKGLMDADLKLRGPKEV